MKDIKEKADIEKLVTAFYEKALDDDLIGHFFKEVVQNDWPRHVQKICDFWASVLIGEHSYSGNPMNKHFELSRKYSIEKEHFERWLFLWQETLKGLYEGPVSEEAAKRARNISALMSHKLAGY